MTRKTALKLSILLSTLWTGVAPAENRYAQMVIPFSSKRKVKYHTLPDQRTLVLHFPQTIPSELTAFESYDERLIRRVIIRDLGPVGTEIHLVLRDDSVRSTINTFQEPFRIVIDLFDVDFEEARDPITGMPLVNESGEATHPQKAPMSAFDGEQYSQKGDMQPTRSSPRQTVAQGRFVQPESIELKNIPGFTQNIEEAPAGRGKAWEQYPEYVYRLQTAPYEHDSRQEFRQELKKASKVFDSTETLASFAGKLFNFGHESRALLAYQQVLQQDPAVFDRDALHLWKFAESHFGQGNLTLADGYYQALGEKHPSSPLAKYALLRRLDIASIRLIRGGKLTELPSLLPSIERIQGDGSMELVAQKALRKAYWHPQSNLQRFDDYEVPKINEELAREFSSILTEVESQRTAFVISIILLSDMLRPERIWTAATGEFAARFFQRFSGKRVAAYIDDLRVQAIHKINTALQNFSERKEWAEIIAAFESLPHELKVVRKDPRTAWILAESYRGLGRLPEAVVHYEQASKSSKEATDRFRAHFWLAVSAGRQARYVTTSRGQNAEVRRLNRSAQQSDELMGTIWSELNEKQRTAIVVTYRNDFEEILTEPGLLKTPARILLENWQRRLSVESAPINDGGNPEWQKSFNPTSDTIKLITLLARRFSELGLPKERRQALQLLKNLKPSELQAERNLELIWAAELSALAEEHRKSNEFLAAGRLYTFTAQNSAHWDRRAEALYKGGLLLYRAGRRTEAMEAFRAASQDGDNIFYANLAKERLERLEQ